jgi:hypothetical protein
MAIVLPCRHAFKKANIETWLKEHNTCPVCRHELPAASGPSAAAAASGSMPASEPHIGQDAGLYDTSTFPTDPFTGSGGVLGSLASLLGAGGTQSSFSFGSGGSRVTFSSSQQTADTRTRGPPSARFFADRGAAEGGDGDAELQAAIAASLEEEAARRQAGPPAVQPGSSTGGAAAMSGSGGGPTTQLDADFYPNGVFEYSRSAMQAFLRKRGSGIILEPKKKSSMAEFRAIMAGLDAASSMRPALANTWQ